MDLLEKMKKVDATAPTPQELEEGVTKLRYMQFREMMCRSRASNRPSPLGGVALGAARHLALPGTRRCRAADATLTVGAS